MDIIEPVEVQIKNRTSGDGHPFSEVLYRFRYEDGSEGRALTRWWFPLPDTEYQRAMEARAFLKRRTANVTGIPRA